MVRDRREGTTQPKAVPALTKLVKFLDRTCVQYESALRTLCGRPVDDVRVERVTPACQRCARTLDEHLLFGLAIRPMSSGTGPTLNDDV